MARQAKERQRQHGGTAPGKAKSLPPNLGEVSEGGETLEILARDIPMGRESLRKDNASYSSGRGFYARQQVRAL